MDRPNYNPSRPPRYGASVGGTGQQQQQSGKVSNDGGKPESGNRNGKAKSNAGDPSAVPPPFVSAKFDVLARVGEGTYGVVYLARARDGVGGNGGGGSVAVEATAAAASGRHPPPPSRARLLAVKVFKQRERKIKETKKRERGGPGAKRGGGGKSDDGGGGDGSDDEVEDDDDDDGGEDHDGISPTAAREASLLAALSSQKHVVRLDSMLVRTENSASSSSSFPASLALAFDFAEHDLYEIVRYHRESLRVARQQQRQLQQLQQQHQLYQNQFRYQQQPHPKAPAQPVPLPLRSFKSIAFQLLRGIEALHSRWIVHRDLKPSNVLINGRDSPADPSVVKVADFGLARSVRSPLRPLSDNGVVVTIWYRAPELLLGASHHGPAVDLWSAGCVLAELVLLCPLFHGREAGGACGGGGDDDGGRTRRPPAAPGNGDAASDAAAPAPAPAPAPVPAATAAAPRGFQADQLRTIFSVLGPPTEASVPELATLPLWAGDAGGVRTRIAPAAAAKIKEKARVPNAAGSEQAAGGGGGAADNGAPSPSLLLRDHLRSRGHLSAGGSLASPLPESGCDLLARLLDYSPSRRMTAEEALRHPFFSEAPLPSGEDAFAVGGWAEGDGPGRAFVKEQPVSYPRRNRTPVARGPPSGSGNNAAGAQGAASAAASALAVGGGGGDGGAAAMRKRPRLSGPW